MGRPHRATYRPVQHRAVGIGNYKRAWYQNNTVKKYDIVQYQKYITDHDNVVQHNTTYHMVGDTTVLMSVRSVLMMWSNCVQCLANLRIQFISSDLWRTRKRIIYPQDSFTNTSDPVYPQCPPSMRGTGLHTSWTVWNTPGIVIVGSVSS